MRVFISTLILACFVASVSAIPPSTYRLQTERRDTRVQSMGSGGGNLLSNSIIDMQIDTLRNGFWFATGNGVNLWRPSDSTWTNAVSGVQIGKGGVSAVQPGRAAVWAATAYDTAIGGQSYPAGGGIGYSDDDGQTWHWMRQPVDSRDTTSYHPTTTNIQNVTYDLAVTNRAVWAADFGGGLRKFTFSDSTWRVRPPDNNPFSALLYLNHRAFSVAAVNDTTLWVGTAGGLNVTSDDGATWQNFHALANDTLSISGNFVVALHVQKTHSGRTVIWAATWQAEDPNEQNAVSWSDNAGLTWHRTLLGEKVHNISSEDSVVYAAGMSGLWKSNDFGATWGLFPTIHDWRGIDRFVESELYTVAAGLNRLMAGGPDGWAVSRDLGFTWTIGRVFVSTQPGVPKSYAYPNPYSPQRFGAVRIQYYLPTPGAVTITVYNFAMEKAGTIVKNVSRPAGDNFELWNGKFGSSTMANGVYFYRIERPGGDAWGKIAIID
jgi:hypothetical protein